MTADTGERLCGIGASGGNRVAVVRSITIIGGNDVVTMAITGARLPLEGRCPTFPGPAVILFQPAEITSRRQLRRCEIPRQILVPSCHVMVRCPADTGRYAVTCEAGRARIGSIEHEFRRYSTGCRGGIPKCDRCGSRLSRPGMTPVAVPHTAVMEQLCTPHCRQGQDCSGKHAPSQRHLPSRSAENDAAH